MTTLENAWVVERTDGVHRVWWASGRQGYAASIIQAGVYTRNQAYEIARQSVSAKSSTCAHEAMRLIDAIGFVKPITVGALVGLGTPPTGITWGPRAESHRTGIS